jgi:hypothetical protein
MRPDAEKDSRSLAYVRWLDACFQEGDCPEQDIEPGVELETVGWLVKEDDNTVSVALEWSGRDRVWRRVQTIPRCLVREMRRVSLPSAEEGRNV